MATEASKDFILGLDLGVGSVGWVLVSGDHILRMGVRVFPPGMDGRIDEGREESRAAKRRGYRLQRRQLRRRARRLRNLFSLLQEVGLLPPGATRSDTGPQARYEVIRTLDDVLQQRPENAQPTTRLPVPQPAQVLPYILRVRALYQRLDLFEVGRALFHLGQRRGFQTNRRQPTRNADEKDQGKVEASITEIREEMKRLDCRTLGEYFAALDPFERRIRARYTARAEYQEEFREIWAVQQAHRGDLLTEALEQRVWHALFDQRPLKSSRHLVGECEFERHRPRAPWRSLAAQRFRLLQKVNDLRIESPDNPERPLSESERATLITALEHKGDLSFEQVRKELGLRRGVGFNLARGAKDKMPGNRTGQKLGAAIDAPWESWTDAQREQLVEELSAADPPQSLLPRLTGWWGLPEEAAQRACDSSTKWEKGYCHLSRKAIHKLLPHLEAGTPYSEAVKQVYDHQLRGGKVFDRLPPVRDVLGSLKNPVVARVLTEARKVVNALLREHGKPAAVRIELARDLKRTRDQRESIAKDNKQRQRERERAAAMLLQEYGDHTPSAADIEKVLLWEECNHRCPYSGTEIRLKDLFGDSPRYQVEHIIPRHLSLDDSFLNKTLCRNDVNAEKGGRTPFVAFSGDPARYELMLEQVRHFQGKARKDKLRRFEMGEDEMAALLADFTARQLNDTRYASRLAADYVGSLYGGRDDDQGQRVFTSAGQVTATLRREWHLEGLLGGGGKNREDHRHHAIDALVVALAEPRWIKELSTAAAQRRHPGRRRVGAPLPWEGFVDEARGHLGRIVVSHRPDHRLAGALHNDTLYSAPMRSQEGEEHRPHLREPVAKVAASPERVASIADKAVREAVQRQLQEVGGDAKRLGTRGEEPWLPGPNDTRIPIRRVRTRQKGSVMPLRQDAATRHVVPGANHHVEVVATLLPSGQERWQAHVVSLWESVQRRRQRQPVVRRDHGPEGRFLFSLMKGDLIAVDGDDDGRVLLVVNSFSPQGEDGMDLEAQEICDARDSKDRKSDRSRHRFRSMAKFQERNARKVTTDVLGRVGVAHD